jgi:hypothetical protein
LTSRFEGIRVRELNFGAFRTGAAVTLPGIGIFVGPGGKDNTNLLKHEFGHILQRHKWGWWLFWFRVAPSSLLLAVRKRQSDNLSHTAYMSHWTEWTSNYLADQYFHGDFNRIDYPVMPVSVHRKVKPFPRFAVNKEQFASDYLAT